MNFLPSRRSGLLLLLVCFGAFWWRLGSIGLIDPDEPFYAQSAREMVQTHDWLTPQIYGAPQFEKPIFYYWMVASSFKALGESELTGRLPTALSATLLVFLVWIWARRALNPRAAFFAALTLATGLEFGVMSRLLLTDVPLAVFLTGSIFCYWLALEDPVRRDRWVFLHFVCTGFAVLTKGPIGTLIPLFAVLAYSAWTKSRPLWRGRGFWAGLAAYAVIVGPWYGLMFAWHGQQFWTEFFIRDNWMRLLYAEHPANNSIGKIFDFGIHYYVGLLLIGSLPWLPATLLSFRRALHASRQDRSVAFLWCWLASSLLFLTIAQSKLPSYGFFLFVPMSLVTGMTLDSLVSQGFRTVGEKRLVLGGAGLQVLAAAVAPLLPPGRPFAIPALLMAVCLLLGLVFLVRGQWGRWLASSAFASMALIVGALTFSRDGVEADSSARPVAQEMLRQQQNGEPLLSGKFLVRGIIYYTRQPVTVFASKPQPFWAAHPLPVVVWRKNGLANYLTSHPTALCAVRESDWGVISKDPSFAKRDGWAQSGSNIVVRAHAPEPNSVGKEPAGSGGESVNSGQDVK